MWQSGNGRILFDSKTRPGEEDCCSLICQCQLKSSQCSSLLFVLPAVVMAYFAVLLNLPLEPELLLYPDESQEAVPWCLVQWGEFNYQSYCSLKGRKGGRRGKQKSVLPLVCSSSSEYFVV